MQFQNEAPLAQREQRSPAGAELMADSSAAVDEQDVNGDGRLDILDAFALARRMERREVIGTRADFNRDGEITRADVDWLARAAVTL